MGSKAAIFIVLILAGAQVIQPPRCAAISIFMHGFSGGSNGDPPGTKTMRDSLGDKVRGTALFGSWDDQEAFVDSIKAAKRRDPTEPIVIVGHSWGADSAIEVTEAVLACSLWVDLLIQIDTFGCYDDVLPSNVTKGVNIWSTSRDLFDGEESVAGSENLGVNGTSHTTIDDKDDPGVSKTPGYEGKNAYRIVSHFLDTVPDTGCAAPLAPAPCENGLGVNTIIEDSLFRALDCVDAESASIVSYVDANDGLLDAVDAARCNVNTTRGQLPSLRQFIVGLHCSALPAVRLPALSLLALLMAGFGAVIIRSLRTGSVAS